MKGIFDNAYAILFLIFFIKAYIVGTHLNCLSKSQTNKITILYHL